MSSPLVFTLFGSTGDLAQKKIKPALLALYERNLLPKDFAIIAFSRRPWTHDDYRKFISPAPKDFLERVIHVSGTFDNADSYALLKNEIESLEERFGQAQKLFYCAVQPELQEQIIKGLGPTGLLKETNSRVLVEKPFGYDEASAKTLEKHFEKNISANQLLRVDHYFAKEGLRALVIERKAKPDFEKSLNSENVASVEIKILEKGGVAGRGPFYDRVGALRDCGQSHILEMLATLLMDISAASENSARTEALKKLELFGQPIFAQYEGYLQEKGVAPDSNTETYFKFELQSQDKRWVGVPFILESGKMQASAKSEIIINFKNGGARTFNIQDSPSGRHAYEILLAEAILGDQAYFSSREEIFAAWRIIDPICQLKHF